MKKTQGLQCTGESGEELLARLISVNTANPPGNEKDLMEVIRKELLEAGCPASAIHTLDHGGNRGSMVVCLEGRDPSVVVGFAGHMDTVPPGDLNQWRGDPFCPMVEEGRMTGRGASDMKGGLAAMLLLARRCLAEPPPVSLRLIFTADEESAGMGITAVREAGWTRDLAFLFVCEPTNCRPALWEKGMLWYRFHVAGESSHASMPEKGRNALEEGFAFLMEAKSAVEKLSPAHPILGGNTFTITGAQGGVKINVLPDQAEFMVDVRFVPGEGTMEQVEKVVAQLAEGRGVEITWQLEDRRDALQVQLGSSEIRRLLDLQKKEPTGVFYFTDASLVIPFQKELPFVILGPGDPGQCHKPNESIRLEEIQEAAELYWRCLEGCPSE